MNVIPIPNALEAAYKGSGHALAAVKNGQLADLIYLRDLLPDFEPDEAERFLADARLGPTIAHLSRVGEVSVGMCSSWEFCEL